MRADQKQNKRRTFFRIVAHTMPVVDARPSRRMLALEWHGITLHGPVICFRQLEPSTLKHLFHLGCISKPPTQPVCFTQVVVLGCLTRQRAQEVLQNEVPSESERWKEIWTSL